MPNSLSLIIENYNLLYTIKSNLKILKFRKILTPQRFPRSLKFLKKYKK